MNENRKKILNTKPKTVILSHINKPRGNPNT